MNVMEPRVRLIAAVLVLALSAAACGSDSADSLASVAPTETTAAANADDVDESSSEDSAEDSAEDGVTDDVDEEPAGDGNPDPVSGDAPSDDYCQALETFVITGDAARAVDDQGTEWSGLMLAYAEALEVSAEYASDDKATVLRDYAALNREASTLSYEDFLADETLANAMIGYELDGLAVMEDDLDACGIQTGFSVSITADDIEAAAGWVDVTAENYAPCDVVDEQTFLVEVLNSGNNLADYELSVVFYAEDGTENEAAATTQLISSLRPGERAVNEGWSLFDGTGESCIVTSIRRAPTAGDGPEAEDRCTVLGISESGFVDFEVEVIGTHDGEVWPTVAFADADGVRRATHQGRIEQLLTGELGTVAETNISGVDDPTVVSCAVVSRINF